MNVDIEWFWHVFNSQYYGHIALFALQYGNQLAQFVAVTSVPLNPELLHVFSTQLLLEYVQVDFQDGQVYEFNYNTTLTLILAHVLSIQAVDAALLVQLLIHPSQLTWV